MSRIPVPKSVKQFVADKIISKFNRQIEVHDYSTPPRLGLRCDNEEIAVQICEKEKKTTWTKVGENKYRKYSFKRKIKKQFFTFDDEKYYSFFEYLTCCGIQSFYAKDIPQHIVYEHLKNYNLNIVYDKNAKYVLDSSDVKLINKFLSFPFDDIYRLAIRSIATGYCEIAIINDSVLSEKILEDLAEIGVKASFLNLTENGGHIIDLIDNFEVVVSTDIRNRKKLFKGNDGKDLYHLPFVRFMAFLDDGFDAYKYKPELDIINNLIPFWERNGIRFIAVQNPDDYGVESRYKYDPLYYKKIFSDLSYVNDFLSPLSCDDIISGQIAIRGNYLGYVDYDSKLRNHRAGERVSVGNTYNDKNDIYFYGPCMMYGMYSSDEETIESFLQKSELGNNYNMHNYCTPAEFANIRMHTMNMKAGDTVVLMVLETELFKKAGIPVISLEDCYLTETKERVKWWWDRAVHVNGRMNRVVADYLVKQMLPLMMRSTNFNDKKAISCEKKMNLANLWLKYNSTFRDWYNDCKSAIDTRANDKSVHSIGCIVMNCNPYTLGHDYLVKYASSKVDLLYLFVLEEDKSYFSFEDRFNMVKKGTESLKNVVVLPSGKYVISANTMPGYFEKEYLQNDILDPSYDLTIFCEAVAPLFHITTRFVGEEPNDKYTKQYNEWMRNILPQYEISLCEIKRFEVNDRPVSGTEVRKMYDEKKWEHMSSLVPSEVLEYLKKIHR